MLKPSTPPLPPADLVDPRGAVARCVERCAGRAWRLASALTSDAAEAHDLVQQACLVLARKAERVPVICDPERDPWPFFAGVLAHEARNARRKRRPATHEDPATMDPIDPRALDPARAAQRAEERARVEAALAELPWAQREAVLLTHLAGLTQAEAAAQLDLPLKTLGSHVKRGLDRLRARLGANEAATVASLALAGLPAPPGGLEAAAALWRDAALAALGPTTAKGGAAAATMGGIVSVKQTSALAVGVVSLVAGLAGGVVLDRAALAPDDRSSSRTPPATSAPVAPSVVLAPGSPSQSSTPTSASEPPVEHARASAPEAATQAGLVRERDALRARVAALEAELAPLRAAREARRPTFTFGKAGAQDFVAEADWPELARAHRAMSAALAEVMAAKRSGAKVPEETMLALQENTERLRRFEFAARGRLGSVAGQNGETTHPLTIANLIAGLVADAGRPLSTAQVDAIAALGEAYERDLAAAHAARPKDTPRVARLLDEYVAKDRFRDGVLDQVLDPAQRDLVVSAADREVAYRDLWDPTLMLIHTSTLVTGADLQEVAGKLPGLFAKRLDEATRARMQPLVDAWARDVVGALGAPSARADVMFFTFEQGRAALEAGVRLYAGLAALLPPDAPERQALLDDAGVPIPRLISPDR